MEKGWISLDLDGCVRNIETKCCQIYKRDVDPASDVSPKDITDFDFNRVRAFSKLKDASKFFFVEHARELFTESELYEQDAPQIVARMMEQFNVCINTNQMAGNERYTYEWLERVGLPYHSVYMGKDKTRVRADFALDDYIWNLVAYRKAGIVAACMDRPWNQDWYGMRVRNLRVFERLLGL